MTSLGISSRRIYNRILTICRMSSREEIIIRMDKEAILIISIHLEASIKIT